MNKALQREIVAHIFANFALIPSDFVDLNRTASLLGPAYSLPEKIDFEMAGIGYRGPLSGCQMSLSLNEIKVLVADCTMDENLPEYAMIVQPKEAPTYGLYLIQNQFDLDDCQPLLAVSVNQGKDWMQLNTGLQATFLAAMEQARDLHIMWKKVEDYKPQYQAMVSFLKFHANLYET